MNKRRYFPLNLFGQCKMLSVFCAVFASLALYHNHLSAQAWTPPAAWNAPPTTSPPKVSLQLAVALKEPGTILAFTLTNQGTEEITSAPEGTLINFASVQFPDGTIKDLGDAVEDHLEITRLKPGESKTWLQNFGADKSYGKYALLQPGLYRIKWKWKLFHPQDREIKKGLLESNEILLWREGGESESKR